MIESVLQGRDIKLFLNPISSCRLPLSTRPSNAEGFTRIYEGSRYSGRFSGLKKCMESTKSGLYYSGGCGSHITTLAPDKPVVR